MTPALIAFIVLQLLDIYTTHRILSKGGIELNPVLAWLFKRFGHLPVLLVFKAIVVRLAMRYLLGAAVVFAGYVLTGEHVLIIFCAVYAAVIAHNWNEMRKAG